MWRLQTSPYSLGWIGLVALNAQSLRSISEKAQHSGSWSGDQMYFCNVFVQWDCWILWTDRHIRVALETVVHNQRFLFSSSPPLWSSSGTFISQVTAGFMWKMVLLLPLHHYRFALCIYQNFNPQLKIFLSKVCILCDVMMMCLVSGVVDTGKQNSLNPP